MPACKQGYGRNGLKRHFRVRRHLLACSASSENSGTRNRDEVDCSRCLRALDRVALSFARALSGACA